MDALKKLIAALDRLQQSQPWLAFPVAVLKKFGEDQAGNLAALIAYYGFASLFPLLLVFVTVLEIVLAHDPDAQGQGARLRVRPFPGDRGPAQAYGGGTHGERDRRGPGRSGSC